MLSLLAEMNLRTLSIAGLALAAGMLIYRSTIRRGRQSADRRGDSGSADQPRPSRLMPGPSFEDARVELHELSRQIIGQIDTKLALLERLIRDARQESDRLEKLLRELRAADDLSHGEPRDSSAASDDVYRRLEPTQQFRKEE